MLFFIGPSPVVVYHRFSDPVLDLIPGYEQDAHRITHAAMNDDNGILSFCGLSAESRGEVLDPAPSRRMTMGRMRRMTMVEMRRIIDVVKHFAQEKNFILFPVLPDDVLLLWR